MTRNEADTRADLIDPLLRAKGWHSDLVRRELRPARVEIIRSRGRRVQPQGRVDYLLQVRLNAITAPVPVAIIEAKAEHLPPSHGLEQAIGYAQQHNVSLVYSTNGHLFVAHDLSTRVTDAPQPLADFPAPTTLLRRYEATKGFALNDPVARALLVGYGPQGGSLRYYQDAAIRAVLEQLIQQQQRNQPQRALLALATGTGKTFIAVQLLHRLAEAGLLRRALFLCDRDELRQQAHLAFQNAFGSNAAIAEAGNPQRNARIVIATYQTLGVADEDGDASFLTQHYETDYFSHIVIDECHRSAWGKWSQVLRRNPNAAQIGLTATPRQINLPDAEDTAEAERDAAITADNVRYFGEPVYTYDLTQGIEDGYLAACYVVQRTVSLDKAGINMQQVLERKPTSAITGAPVSQADLQALYTSGEFERLLQLPDRVEAMCYDLFQLLREAEDDPHQKAIIFCVSDQHADAVAAEMNNRYYDWCLTRNRTPCEVYAFKCTAAAGSDLISDLRGAASSHFIATTVDLLATGVDVPRLGNVVFFRYLRSPILFYQMVGRGTRIDEPNGKLMFTVYDYTNATRLFGEEFLTRNPVQAATDLPPDDDPAPPDDAGGRRRELVRVTGFDDVQVTSDGQFILTSVDGREQLIALEEYTARLQERLLAHAPDLAALRETWVDPPRRRALLGNLPNSGEPVGVLQQLRRLYEYDWYDVLAQVGYAYDPVSRTARVMRFEQRQQAWLRQIGRTHPLAPQLVRALLGQFAQAGIVAFEQRELFQIPTVQQAGGMATLQALGVPAEVLRDIKVRLLEL